MEERRKEGEFNRGVSGSLQSSWMTEGRIRINDRSPLQYSPGDRRQHHLPPSQRHTIVFSVRLERNNGRRRQRTDLSKEELETLIYDCPIRSKAKVILSSGFTAAKLFFPSWREALEAVVYFWGRKLDCAHEMTVRVVSYSSADACNRGEEAAVLRDLFARHARGLLSCECVRRYDQRIEEVVAQMREFSLSKKKPIRLDLFQERRAVQNRLVEEMHHLRQKQGEFQAGLLSILRLLGEGEGEEIGVEKEEGDEVEVFQKDSELDLNQVHCLLMRERRRLDEGLPIYAYRTKILNAINSNQVVILVGETGSGKSTQIVQYLADTWLDAPGIIICTQPRKIAAASLAKRVSDESHGCYPTDLATSCTTYSPAHTFRSRVVFTTDHCLLQLLMNRTNLSSVSHIIIDEAHERSLNTDLVLALTKSLLLCHHNLRLIVMSATADTKRLSDYFYGCLTFSVTGRSFPVEVNYVDPAMSSDITPAGSHPKQADYVVDVVRMVRIIHQREEEGAILAFLTSQMEVEWACEQFSSPSAVVLPLHGKLSYEEQQRVFQNFPGKRKVIFSTNIAETSLTISGIKYVVDSGMVKESRFDPNSGMNVLRVCRISQSSAKQRAGRAGRTGPGKCYRLYSEFEFQSMDLHQEPEIRKVHLGIAVLRIISLGVKRVEEFDFVDSPDLKSVDSAIQNLLHLGAVVRRRGGEDEWLELTETGRCLTKLGMEPRLGKMILECHGSGLTKEGIVLAAVMANASSIFCRVGSEEEKLRADCLKVPFCHQDGDLFTFLSVYQEWEQVQESKNSWCWQNSVNAKSMRRCQETVEELDACLYNELDIVVPTYWKWQKQGTPSEYCKLLKTVILSSLVDNVAVFSGCEQLGYEVALTGQHLPLHPSCSLLVYGKKPSWVVFGEILSISKQYLVCVTAVDSDCLHSMKPPPPFDPLQLLGKTMKKSTIIGVSCAILRRLYGKGSGKFHALCSRIQKACNDNRIRITVDFDSGTIQLLASLADVEKVSSMMNDALDCHSRCLRNECMEKSLFRSTSTDFSPPTALLGAGGEIRHLELNGRQLSVEICHGEAQYIDELEILMAIDCHVSGVAAIHRYVDDPIKWGKITFLSPDDADTIIAMMDGMELHGSPLKLTKSAFFSSGGDPFPLISAKIFWPRRPCKGMALVRCATFDVYYLVQDLSGLLIGQQIIRAEVSMKTADCVFLSGLSKDTSEEEILEAISRATTRRVFSVRLLRGKAIEEVSTKSLEDAILREIIPFIPRNKVRVEVMEPENAEQTLAKAFVKFDGSLHLEAARALTHLSGKALSVCQPWQKIQCQRDFRTTLICPSRIFPAIESQLLALIHRFNSLPGVHVSLEETKAGFYRVKMAANGTNRIADLRRPLDELLKGKAVAHPDLTVAAAQLICSRGGADAARSIEQETGTHILHDKRTGLIRIFGPQEPVLSAEEKLLNVLLSLHNQSQLQLRLRGNGLPADLVKQLVDRFGPDMSRLEEQVPGATFSLDIRRHVLHIRGRKEHRRKAEQIIFPQSIDGQICAICLCDVEDPYQLEECGHKFCRSCLMGQLESAIRTREGFPLSCLAMEGKCKAPILLLDLRSLLPAAKMEELFLAALAVHVAASGGAYRFCPSPDCPGIYRVADEGEDDMLYSCAACTAETCRRCHVEYHPWVSCEKYKEIKEDPDVSLEEWRRGKSYVKNCLACGHAIEKTEGCSHVACRCGRHICWDCLETFSCADECYVHIRSAHEALV